MKKLYLVLIFLLALVLRIYQLDKVPVGLSNDEISIAYNAYSIMETGRDEYGQTLPISFKSHNTYKAPVLIYIVAPLTKIFGNNEWSVRLPSAVLGSLTVIILGLVVFELTKNKNLSLWSAFILAVTPWHIYTSRVGFESNVALFFLLLGVYLFLKGLKKQKWMIVSVISFVISMYSYHTEWVFTPLLIAALVITFFSELKHKKSLLLLGAALFILLTTPLIFDGLSHASDTRAGTEILTKDPTLIKILESNQNGPLAGMLIITDFWIKSYLSYFNPAYLFFNALPVPSEFSSQRLGLFNFIQLPLMLMGLMALLKSEKSFRKLIIFWLLTGPLVPSLTLGGLNLVRNLVSIVPFVVLIALGSNYFIKQFQNLKKLTIILIFVILLNLFIFLETYFIHFPIESAENWSYGFKEMALYLHQNKDKYQELIVDPNYGVLDHKLVGVPSLFILYFDKLDPAVYLTQKKDQNGQLIFENYTIREVNWVAEKINPHNLYVTGARVTPLTNQKVREVNSIYLPDGNKAFSFFESY
ncbi:MAG: glycosyltransferase family 39 protein [Candidatus Daviesbacteria bacterium]|nr:glycosyltransferase family 39 protein [Candidatus Daviesbacteria bacterium]